MLKTGWTDEMVLRNPHSSNRRKFDLYRELDKMHAATPIVALPILSKDAGTEAYDRLREAQHDLYEIMGLVPRSHLEATSTDRLGDDTIRAILEYETGDKLIPIEELLKKRNK